MKYPELCEMLLNIDTDPETATLEDLEKIAEERNVLSVIFYRLGGKPITLSLDGIFQDNYDNYVGDSFLDARTSQRLSQSKVARPARIDQPTYSKYELGERSPRISVLHRISQFLELRPEYLRRREDA
ncbi:MAG: hypothetical protein CMH61_00350 [Nanoarchaeota archaeon]|nr:hypothetical protein [Nanoarchaeota archaeon]|tara:strand:- start:1574 stop:1957 length:384 start_codon:yes stop_codon:yes gene_type:complete